VTDQQGANISPGQRSATVVLQHNHHSQLGIVSHRLLTVSQYVPKLPIPLNILFSMILVIEKRARCQPSNEISVQVLAACDVCWLLFESGREICWNGVGKELEVLISVVVEQRMTKNDCIGRPLAEDQG